MVIFFECEGSMKVKFCPYFVLLPSHVCGAWYYLHCVLSSSSWSTEYCRDYNCILHFGAVAGSITVQKHICFLPKHVLLMLFKQMCVLHLVRLLVWKARLEKVNKCSEVVERIFFLIFWQVCILYNTDWSHLNLTNVKGSDMATLFSVRALCFFRVQCMDPPTLPIHFAHLIACHTRNFFSINPRAMRATIV